MRPKAPCAITWLLFVPASLLASDRYFWYSVSAGGSLYQVGDTVHWKISAGAAGSEVTGIRTLDCALHESRGEVMKGPLTVSFYVGKQYGFITNCLPENYYAVPGTG